MAAAKNNDKKNKRANNKNLNKTTRKGAYKPARKKQFAIRAPIVKAKKRTPEDIATGAS